MNIKTFLISILMIAVSTSAAISSSLQEVKDSTFIFKRDGVGRCSGQFVAEQIFLTASHCIYGDNAIYTIDIENQPVVLHFINKHRDSDVAILVPTTPTIVPTVDVDFIYEPELGEEVYTAGYTDALYFSVAKGLYSGMIKHHESSLELQRPGIYLSSGVVRGQSGGGLYRKVGDDYRLIGLISNSDGVTSMAAPIQYLFNFED